MLLRACDGGSYWRAAMSPNGSSSRGAGRGVRDVRGEAGGETTMLNCLAGGADAE
jgi:hypothetical protein